MFLIYRVVRWGRQWLRRCFHGEPPSWAVDIYKAVKVVNFVELIPTIAAIALVPRHFFERLNVILQPRRSGVRKSIYKTPINLVINILALLFATRLFSSFVSPASFKTLLAAILITLPILIPVCCVVVCILGGLTILLWFALVLLGPSSSSGEVTGDIFELLCDCLSYVSIPLDPSTYAHLDRQKVTWCALYFYGYLIAGPIFVVVGIGELFFHGAKFLPNPIANNPFQPKLTLAILFLAFFAVSILLARMVIFPYSAALIASLKTPTSVVLRNDIQDLSSAIDKLRIICQDLNGKTLSTTDRKKIGIACACLIENWARFQQWWARHVIRYSIPQHSRQAEKARVLAMTEIGKLLEATRTLHLDRRAMQVIASIYVKSKLPAEQGCAKSLMAEWFPWAAPFGWELAKRTIPSALTPARPPAIT